MPVARKAVLTKDLPLLFVHVGVSVGLFIMARFVPGDVNSLPTVVNDLLACLGGILVVWWPAPGAAFYFLSLILSLTDVALSTPTTACIALVLLAVALRSPWVAALVGTAYITVLVTLHRALQPIEIVFEFSLMVASFGIGAAWHRARQISARREAEAAEERERFRLQFARGLHDSLARSHVLITLRLESALADETLSETTRQKLLGAESATKQAVADLRALVGTLRSTGTDVASIGTAPAPLPTLVDEQLERLRAEGFTAEAILPDVEDSAEISRVFAPVLIEATTNILKHGAPGPCRFVFRVAEDTAMLTVSSPTSEDNSADSQGHGLLGIAERLEAIGGDATWHCRGDQWVLIAAAPLEARVS